jgi:hypothetical protein
MEDRQTVLKWFGGNEDAANMYYAFVDLSHVWDDLVDKDKEVSDLAINSAFLSCLVYLPANPFYRQIQNAVMPMWITVVSAYETGNKFEKDKDPHGVEIAHTLRYAAGHILAYAIHVCVGPEKAREFLPDMWKTVVYERYDAYKDEVLNESA